MSDPHPSRNLNAAKCAKCGDVVVSKSRHDYVSCKCGAIAVDGGFDYAKWSGNAIDIVYLTPDEKRKVWDERGYHFVEPPSVEDLLIAITDELSE